ncbi:MAG: hypothetical protein WBB33_00730 [Candidatus Saccharimonadales bacterium]
MLRGFYSNVRHLVQMRHVVLLALAMCCASVIVTTLPSHAGASSLPGNQTAVTPIAPLVQFAAPENVNTTASDEEIVCVAGALGYITCPLLDISAKMIRFIAVLLDVVFNFQALNNDSIRGVWSIFANLANISLAVVFLIVVMSQASSIGISNYGVKRMLPRIVAAAILINMSFYVCALAIDVSNVLGHNMMGFIGNLTSDRLAQTNAVAQRTPACQVIGQSVGRTGAEVWKWTNPVGWGAQAVGVDDDIENATGWVGGKIGGLFGSRTACSMAIMAAGLMGGIGVITLIIAVILIAVFIAFITTVALAFMRYTILIFLVILAPLAFAAWVLPGTEGLFKKWWNLFLKLLMIYPIAMFMFGASMFAASVIGAVVSDGGFIADLFPDSNITQESIDAVWAALQLFIIAMPLFFIPKLFKSMDSITGGLAGKMAAAGTLGGAIRGARKGVKTYNKGRKVYNSTPYGQYRQAQYQEKLAHARAGKPTNSWRANLVGGAQRAMGGHDPEFIRRTGAASNQLEEKRLDEESAIYGRGYSETQHLAGVGDSKTMRDIVLDTSNKYSKAEKRAALGQLGARQDFEYLDEIKEATKSTSAFAAKHPELSQELAKEYSSFYSKNASSLQAAPTLNPNHRPDVEGGWDANAKVSPQKHAQTHAFNVQKSSDESFMARPMEVGGKKVMAPDYRQQVLIAQSFDEARNDPRVFNQLDNRKREAMQTHDAYMMNQALDFESKKAAGYAGVDPAEARRMEEFLAQHNARDPKYR